MNITASEESYVADDDIVRLTCSMKYHTSVHQKAHVVIDHISGADVIERDTLTPGMDATELRYGVTVKVKSVKDTEHPTSFGPLQCTVHFRHRAADVVHFASNQVQFASDKINSSYILSKSFNICIAFL